MNTLTSHQARIQNYLAQNRGAPLTPAQQRRLRHKRNHLAAQAESYPQRRRRSFARFARGEGWGISPFRPFKTAPGSPVAHDSRDMSGKRTARHSAPGPKPPVARDTSGKRTAWSGQADRGA